MRYLGAFVIFLSVILSSCSNPNAKEKDISKLFAPFKGTWITSDSTSQEKWQLINGNVTAEVYSISSSDTTLTETIRIVNENNEVFYEATVLNQNEGKSIKFKLLTSDSTDLVFENKAHDFPQRIAYHFLNSDEIQVSISSENNGKKKEYIFNYLRINN